MLLISISMSTEAILTLAIIGALIFIGLLVFFSFMVRDSKKTQSIEEAPVDTVKQEREPEKSVKNNKPSKEKKS